MFPSRRNIPCCLFILALSTPPLLALPTTNPNDRPAVLQRQREHYLQAVRSLPALEQHKMSEILTLRLVGRQLVPSTPLKPWPNFEGRRVEIEGMRFPATLIYAQFIADNPAARQFDFKLEDYPDNDLFGQLRLQWRPDIAGIGGDLSVEMAEQTSHSFHRVFYMQAPGMARLLVFANDSSADHNLQSFNYMERDFQTLRNRHPDEVQEWLRPIFHRLQQDAVFAPEVNAVWQVLASRWPAPEKVKQAVNRLLPALGSQQFRLRNRAADELAALGRDGASAILQLDRSGLSLEQKVRLDEVLARFRRMNSTAAARLAENPDFLLDCQYCEDATARQLAAGRLAEILRRPVDLQIDGDGSIRFDAVEKIRGQICPVGARNRVPQQTK